MINQVSSALIEETLAQARASNRKRAMACLHKPEENLQRMINACLKGTYFTPHKSLTKLKIFTPLVGRAAFCYFNDAGEFGEIVVVDAKGPVRMVEIPLDRWCAPVVLSDEVVFLEIVSGKYDAKTHKHFAPWAPMEDDEKAIEYLKGLEEKAIRHIQS